MYSRITSIHSPYPLMQQRFSYMYQNPDQTFTSILENVPQWSSSPFSNLEPAFSTIGEYAPLQGDGLLIDAICQRENQKYGTQLKPQHVLVTMGALYGISLILRKFQQPNAIALCQAPLLYNIVDMLPNAGYQTEYFTSHNGQIDIEQLRSRCTDNVRVIYINTPQNPTGEVCSAETIQQLANLADERGIALIIDIVYDNYVFSDDLSVSLPKILGTSPYVFAANSMSKSFGAPGLRVGWILSMPDNIELLGARLDQECLAVCSPTQHYARQLLETTNVTPLQQAVQEGNQLIRQELKDWSDIQLPDVKAGALFFFELPISDIEAFADFMLVEYGVFFATSDHYGGIGGSYIRIPMGQPASVLKPALALLKEGLQVYRARYE